MVAVGFQLLTYHRPSEKPTEAGLEAFPFSKVWAVGLQSHFFELHGSGNFPFCSVPQLGERPSFCSYHLCVSPGFRFVLSASNTHETTLYICSSLIFLISVFFQSTRKTYLLFKVVWSRVLFLALRWLLTNAGIPHGYRLEEQPPCTECLLYARPCVATLWSDLI